MYSNGPTSCGTITHYIRKDAAIGGSLVLALGIIGMILMWIKLRKKNPR